MMCDTTTCTFFAHPFRDYTKAMALIRLSRSSYIQNPDPQPSSVDDSLWYDLPSSSDEVLHSRDKHRKIEHPSRLLSFGHHNKVSCDRDTYGRTVNGCLTSSAFVKIRKCKALSYRESAERLPEYESITNKVVRGRWCKERSNEPLQCRRIAQLGYNE